jgi:replicative DNA helicase
LIDNSASIEKLILSNLITNNEFFIRTIPHIKGAYFTSPVQRIAYAFISDYFDNYNKQPSYNALAVIINTSTSMTEQLHGDSHTLIQSLSKLEPEVDVDWLVDRTEEFCKSSAVRNAIKKSTVIYAGESDETIDAIPDIMKDALSVSFDTDIGHRYIGDYEKRHEYYNRIEYKVPFAIEMLNKVTNGGATPKTLNIVMAPPNTGKTMFMANLAVGYLREGKNVLYITLEMAEEEIGKRIDANVLDIQMDSLEKMSAERYKHAIEKATGLIKGELIIKEYPTSGANVNHFTSYLRDLELKEGFKPDCVFVDYMGITSSVRVKAADNMYSYQKSVAEELRGFAQENELILWTAVQTNRAGWGASDINMENVAESAGTAATCDFMVALIATDESRALGKITIKQVKSRYGDKDKFPKFDVDYIPDRQRVGDSITQPMGQTSVKPLKGIANKPAPNPFVATPSPPTGSTPTQVTNALDEFKW